MLCEIEYKQPSAGEKSCDGDQFRIRKIIGRADRIHAWLKKQNDVAAIKIIVRPPSDDKDAVPGPHQ